MNCEELVETVTAFLDGALDEEHARAYLDHVELCGGCEEFVEQIRVTVRVLGLGGLPPSDGLSEGVRNALLLAFRERGRAGR